MRRINRKTNFKNIEYCENLFESFQKIITKFQKIFVIGLCLTHIF